MLLQRRLVVRFSFCRIFVNVDNYWTAFVAERIQVTPNLDCFLVTKSEVMMSESFKATVQASVLVKDAIARWISIS